MKHFCWAVMLRERGSSGNNAFRYYFGAVTCNSYHNNVSSVICRNELATPRTCWISILFAKISSRSTTEIALNGYFTLHRVSESKAYDVLTCPEESIIWYLIWKQFVCILLFKYSYFIVRFVAYSLRKINNYLTSKLR